MDDAEELDEEATPDYVINSMEIQVVLDAEGDRGIKWHYPVGNPPSSWDVLGWLEYVAAAIRTQILPGPDD